MANKPTVTLTFAGDSSKLSKAFDDVGASAEKMSRRVQESSDSASSAGDGIDALTEKADGAEGRFIGFTDTVSGLQGAFEGISDPSLSFGERLAVLGQSAADLAGGLASLVIPALGGMWQKLMATSAAQATLSALQTVGTAITGALSTAWGALNAVMRANPIMTVITIIGLLVAAFVVLWNKSEGFRNFFIGMWNGIKATVGSVVNWIKGAWNGVVGFFGQLPSRIGAALGGLASAAKNVFKGAVNGVVDGLNWFLDHSINWLINKVNDISGIIGIPAIPTIPHIPRMHTGGVVSGMLGSEQLRVLQAGERVVPRGQGGSGGTSVVFGGNVDSAFATYFMKLVRSGDIQIGTV